LCGVGARPIAAPAGAVVAVVASLLAVTVLPAQRPSLTAADSAALRQLELSVESARFFEDWRRAWMLTERARLDSAQRTGFSARTVEARRAPWLHCHGPNDASDSRGPQREIRRAGAAAIMGAGTMFPVCPSWLLDERDGPAPTGRDAELAPAHADSIRVARQRLTDAWAAASLRYPEHPLFVEQWLRHLMAAGHRDSALRVAGSCRSERWWCDALLGWSLYHNARPALAEAAFVAARAAMPFEARCRWDDVRELIGELEDAPTLEDCGAASGLADTLFWLADPLWMDAHNERRLLHDVRTVELTLAMQLPLDEHYRWLERYRGDAVARMVLRYGWPSVRRWGGTTEDASHDQWMRRTMSDPQRPYTTHEYTPGRVHLVPAWPAVRRPETARAADWQLGPTPATADEDWWWPHEHVALDRPLAALAAGQWGFLRRADSVLLFVAHDHPAAGARAAYTSALVRTTSPSHREFLDHRAHRTDSVLGVVHQVASEPALLGVELREPGAAGRDWRARFGVTPPPPLRAASLDTATAVILSDLLLLRADDDTPARQHDDEFVAARLLGTDVVRTDAHPALTVLWERYDVAPSDSVRYTLTVERIDTRSAWQRMGDALRLRRDARTFVQIQWVERAGSDVATLFDDPVRTFRHSVRVNVAPLEAGVYDLQLEVHTPDGASARSERRVTLRP
jgi:hypothetical protein